MGYGYDGLVVDAYNQSIPFMSYSRVPEAFMDGAFLAPHSFSDPQNPQHGQYVNLQLRNDLYFSTLEEISRVQFSAVPFLAPKEWIQVTAFKPCRGDMGYLNRKASEWKKQHGRTLEERPDRKVEVISCQEWQVAYHKGTEGKEDDKRVRDYRVHVLQTDNDIFKTEIFPSSTWAILKDLLIN